MTKVNLAEVVAEGVRKSQTVFHDTSGDIVDRSKTVSASSWAKCARAQRFSKDKVPYDEGFVDNWGWAEAGNGFEDWLVPKIIKGLPHGVYLEAAGEHQRTLIDPDARLSATPDGLIVSRANDEIEVHGVKLKPGSEFGIGLEIKSRGPNASSLPKFEHVKQAEFQIELWNRVAGVKVDAVLLYYGNRDRFDEIDVFVVPRCELVWDAAKTIAGRIFDAKDPFELTPEGKAIGECTYCPFKVRCGMGELRVPDRRDPELPPEEADKLRKAIEVRQIAIAQEKAANLAKTEADHRIKQILRNNDTSYVKVDGATASLSKVKGREKLDKDALAASGVDLGEYTKTGVPSVRLNVRGKV